MSSMGISGFLMAANLHGAVVYTTDFDSFTASDTLSSPFVETIVGGANSSIVAISGTDLGLRQVATGTSGTPAASTIAALTSSGLTSTGGGFRLSTTFTLDAFTIGSAGVANINAYGGANAGFSTGYRISYNTGLSGGTLTISEQGGSATSTTVAGIPPVAGTVITLTMVALYNSSTSAVVTGYLYNGAGDLIGSTSFTDTSALATGTSYGLRTAISGNGTTETATFTSFTLESVPEPTSVALFAAAAGLAGLRRKRA